MRAPVLRRTLLAVSLVALAAAGWAVASGPRPLAASRPPDRLPDPRRVLFDGFGGDRLDRRIWTPYTGLPGGDPGGWWAPSHVVVRDAR